MPNKLDSFVKIWEVKLRPLSERRTQVLPWRENTYHKRNKAFVFAKALEDKAASIHLVI